VPPEARAFERGGRLRAREREYFPRISRNPQLQFRKNYLTEKDSFPSQIPIVVIKQTSSVQPGKTKESGWLPYHHRILTLRTTSRILLLPPLPRVCTVCAHTMPSQNVGFLFSQRIALLDVVIDGDACIVSIAHYEIHRCRRQTLINCGWLTIWTFLVDAFLFLATSIWRWECAVWSPSPPF